ncbi:hypothetical protein ACHQM5_011987 [Ranunculus cassubicifolius]
MAAGDVSLVCCFNGKLSNENKDAKYIGGSTKGSTVPKSILFASFKEKIQRLINLPSNGMEIKIKCGVRFDKSTLIGVDVDDDDSLRFVMEHSKFIMAYILQQVPRATIFTATQREDPMLASAAIQFQAKNLIDGTSNNKSVEVNTTEVKPPDNEGMNANKDASPSQSKLREWFPEKLVPLIANCKYPLDDGNCGFRALCMALSRNESEWVWMRAMLVKEIEFNKDFYHQLFSDEETCTLLQRTQHSHGLAPPPNWMDMPSTGFVFSQAFNVVLVYYSEKNCCTFVPFLSPPYTDNVNVKVLGIGLVKNNHYINLDFEDGCPLPPFPHIPSNWRTICPAVANCWEKLLEPRLIAFGTIKLPELQFGTCPRELIMIDEEDLVHPSAANICPAKNFSVNCIDISDGTHNNNPVEDVNELGDVNCIDNSGADINRSGDMHHRFSQSNVDHHCEGINLPISNQEDDNEVHMQEEMMYDKNQVTSQMEQMMPLSDADVCIPTSGYEPAPLKFTDYGFALGREFSNINALKNALSDMAVETGREYKHGRTSPSKLTMKCKDSRCDWSIQATRLPNSPAFKVLKYQEVHTCVVLTNSGDKDHPQATVRWILSKVQSNIEKDPNMEPMKIVKQMKERYGILVSYNKAVKAKTMALDLMRNQKKDSYPLPRPDICCALVKELEGGGTVCKLGLSSDGGSFQHLFWAFPACVEALRNHLRPVIYVCSEKIEIGVLMYAHGIDGSGFYGDFIQVGFALCVREDEKTWERFLGWLKEFVLPPQPPPTFTIVTDFEKPALIRAVQNVLPHIHHFFSPWSFREGFIDKFHDTYLYILCLKACRTFSVEECEAALQEIRRLNEGAYEWIESVGSKSQWAIAFSPNKHVWAVMEAVWEDVYDYLGCLDRLSIVEIVESSRDMVATLP